ncbi:acetate--CoA ligase [Desulfosarcina ovata subsp. sediminis]|uniref:Acetate--CoA ligase n=1 Tax=Desulfosarcina ovata subsp. sediminis TaxID=885957 RepID=A0A5K7ZLM7_9BACT|nr:CoA-binding protein [Desulfosarcina ovata]BBO81205.1 acetate--CoA ligase [Desulfosarcina ovata subsp. sediminis]
MNLDRLLKPESVAVVGVSITNDNHPANVIFKKLQFRYPVDVYAVNNRGGEIHGVPVYDSLAVVPDPIDLAVVAVRAKYALDVVNACIDLDVGGAIIVSGGFAETGNVDLQNQVAEVAKAADFPIIGPNCLGLFSPGKVDTFILPSERMEIPKPGGVAIISQSGAFLVDLLVKFSKHGIGVSQAISIGNKAVLGEIDLLNYLKDDPETKVITLYIEGFAENEGRAFVEAATCIGKPVVVNKSGKSAAGSRAVSSHTASIAGDYKVFSEVFAQHGIIEAQNEYEILSYCKVLNSYPRNIERNVGIITISGGHGAAATDMCAARGFGLPEIPEAVRKRIYQRLSPSVRDIAAINNPVDLTASAIDEDFVAVYDEMTNLPEFDAFLMLVLPYSTGVSIDLGAKVSNPSKKRVRPLVAYIPHMAKYQAFIEGFELNGVPVSDSIDGAVMMLEGMRRYQQCFRL